MPQVHKDGIDTELENLLLLRLIKDRDEFALGKLYDNSVRLVYSLIIRILKNAQDSEEVTQEVFFSVWEKASNFDVSKGKVLGWIVAIARNKALDRLRSKRHKQKTREVTLVENVLTESGADSLNDDVSQQIILQESADLVNSATKILPKDEKQLIELAFYEGFTHSEIANYLDMPLGTVKTKIRKAVSRMRDDMLKKEYRTLWNIEKQQNS